MQRHGPPEVGQNPVLDDHQPGGQSTVQVPHRVVHTVHHQLLSRHGPGLGQEGGSVEALAEGGVGPDAEPAPRERPQLGRVSLLRVDGEEVDRVRELRPQGAQLFQPAQEGRSGAAAHVDDQRSPGPGPVQQLQRLALRRVQADVDGVGSLPGALEEVCGHALRDDAEAGPGDELHQEVGVLFLQANSKT